MCLPEDALGRWLQSTHILWPEVQKSSLPGRLHIAQMFTFTPYCPVFHKLKLTVHLPLN